MSDHENLLLKLRRGFRVQPNATKLGSLSSTILPVLYLTITELARESGTSEASVTRLCRTLGCKGYNEFKMALALDIQQGLPERQAGDAIDNVVDESVRRCKIPQNSSTGPSLNRRHWPCIRRSQCKFTEWRPARFWGIFALQAAATRQTRAAV